MRLFLRQIKGLLGPKRTKNYQNDISFCIVFPVRYESPTNNNFTECCRKYEVTSDYFKNNQFPAYISEAFILLIETCQSINGLDIHFDNDYLLSYAA